MRGLAIVLALLLGACGTNIKEDAKTVVNQGGRAITTNNDNRFDVRQQCLNDAIDIADEMVLAARNAAREQEWSLSIKLLKKSAEIKAAVYPELITLGTYRRLAEAEDAELPKDFEPLPEHCQDVANLADWPDAPPPDQPEG